MASVVRSLLFILLLAISVSALSTGASHRSQKGRFLGTRFAHLDNSSPATTFQKDGFPGAANCSEHWFTQFIDHFSFGPPAGAPAGQMTYQQKYLTYNKYYEPGGPIFFYAGNEGPISIFADIAGLMWQNAKEFKAALVFAEHRFYGESQPCDGNFSCWVHLNTMQAMADYSVLLTNLTSPTGMYKDSVGVITFGGSYGGMLSAWMRIKYPNIITGSIASSGPIRMVSPSYRRSSYWEVITRDATAAGGSAPNCSINVYNAIQAALGMVETTTGRQHLGSIFKTCSPISASKGRGQLGLFIQAAFDLLGMGDYPMPINFIFGTVDHAAPAWPMRVACEFMMDSTTDNTTLLQNLMKTISVVYNVTEDVSCYDIDVNPTTGGHWDYMVCSEGIINELPYFEAKGWPNDMFYPQPAWTHEMFDAHCEPTYGIKTRWGWLNTTYGAGNVEGATNIVFANGDYDPWHSGGILHNVSDTVRSYIIPEGAHHLDLLFTTQSDPPLVQWVRSEEMRHVRMCLDALKASKGLRH